MMITPAAYTPTITTDQDSVSVRAAKPRRRMPGAGGAPPVDSRFIARGADDLAGSIGCWTRPMTGARSATFGPVARITIVQSGSASDTTGSRRTPMIASVHTRWRVAADVHLYSGACTIAATPNSTDALTIIKRAADIAGSTKNVLIAHLPVRGRV